MTLSKIRSEDLIFSNEIGDDRTNTLLELHDYDWMDYSLTTRFRTEEMGVLDVKFNYSGTTSSVMEVQQTLNDETRSFAYSYPTDIFIKHITRYLEKHIASWGERYAFNGEEYVMDFFNDVLDNGEIAGHEQASHEED